MSDWETERAEENEAKRRSDERFAASVAKRKAEEAELDSRPLLSEEKELATELHELLCRWNHTDGCGWLYFKGTDSEWNRESSHVEYIRMARIIITQNDNAEETIKTIQLIKAAKKAV